MRLVAGQAAAAGAAGLAEAAEEPFLRDVARLVEQPLRLLVLLAIPLDLPRELLLRLPLVLLALVAFVEEDLLEVRLPRDRRVEPLLVGVRELVVEDGDGVVDAAALEGVAGPAVVVDAVLLDHLQGPRKRVVQRDRFRPRRP